MTKIQRELQITADGSHTLFIPSMDEHYHSINGAVQESQHVFIEAGLHRIQKPDIRILEIGFGTGLNALLTLKNMDDHMQQITYHTIENYPLDQALIEKLNYGSIVWPEEQHYFKSLHAAPWNEYFKLSDKFILHKIDGDLTTCDYPQNIDLIYFDAFAPDKQPEMWTQEIFDRLSGLTNTGGLIVTYCAKGEVRRRMQAAGFKMQRLPGPPGKRHMLLGEKI